MSKALKTQKKRRRQNKTDYKARLALLKANAVRIAIRKTNKYIIIQAIESNEAQDRIIAGTTSKNLIEKGWDEKFSGSLKSVPAAYLSGIMMAGKLDKNKKYIIDIGMARGGNRIFAAVKGLIDAGIGIKADKKAFPPENRLNGEHLDEEIKNMIAKVKEKLNANKGGKR